MCNDAAFLNSINLLILKVKVVYMLSFSTKYLRFLKSSVTMPKVVKLADHLDSTQDVALGVATLLKSGKVVAVPTDTVYGVAGHAQSSSAIHSIYKIKGRNCRKPLAICVSDITDIPKWGKIDFPLSMLSDLFPGPVTILLERQQALNAKLNPGVSLVGIRIPDNDFIRTVCWLSGGPLALTSANISNTFSTLAIEEFKDLWPSLDLIIDGGVLGCVDPKRLGSTVIDLSTKGHYKILRDGCALEKTRKVVHQYSLKEL